jgi:hypothetical protein
VGHVRCTTVKRARGYSRNRHSLSNKLIAAQADIPKSIGGIYDTALLASGSYDDIVKIWVSEPGACQNRGNEGLRSLALATLIRR